MRVFLLLLLVAIALGADTIYRLDSVQASKHGWVGSLSLVEGSSRYGQDLPQLRLTITFQTEDRLRFTISDPNVTRWRVPSFTIADHSLPTGSTNHSKFEVEWTNEPFSLRITRKSDLRVLFDTNVLGGSLTFQDQFLQISTQLGQESAIYGLGEQISNMRLDYRNYTLWTLDEGTVEKKNLYGSHPFYMQVTDGKAHGIFLHSSNGMDVEYTTTDGVDRLTYRVIGGIFDFYVFAGPTPEEVVMQYTKLVGRPYLPPYWSLGFHNCRWGYKDLAEVKEVVKGYKDADIPLETMWTDIDYMDEYRDFTFDPIRFPHDEMKRWVDELHSNGQHYMLIVDPGIQNKSGYFAFDDGEKLNLWVKNRHGESFLGKVWPGLVYFPDWFHPSANEWWQANVQRHHDIAAFDGMWIDMNEIINFCDGDCRGYTAPVSNGTFDPNFPPYGINNAGERKPLNSRSLDMDATHYGGLLQYNVHNLHGYMEARSSTMAMEKIKGERALVISRSTYAGSGSHGGHWTGDNDSTWRSLQMSLPDILNFNMYGVPMIGADICGFNGGTTEELCARWIQIGAFYPFSRDHNAINEKSQELYLWKSVAENARKVLAIRYSILPLYYTLFYEAHEGIVGTVIRPLWFHFPEDIQALDVDEQIFVGKGVLVTPVLTQNATEVTGYFPPSSRWFDFYTFREISGGYVTLPAPLDTIPIHLRGGLILPRQAPSYVLRDAINNPYDIVVVPDYDGRASGSLYLDDGKTIDTREYTYLTFEAQSNGTAGAVASKVQHDSYENSKKIPLGQVSLLGVDRRPTEVEVNGQSFEFDYEESSKTVTVHMKLPISSAFRLTWA
ncbi:putative alpha-glucosidase [Planoprotostelium fungivorum]|uniref:alpha-glucosidase n=1 Tax=Planoprotostelium fungivorum TaxID=1890364 RepID=A0A2P6MRU3_9EUKA|nr:putative alpha-glucosidase [Planoprotostelium fungivorum]